MKDREENIMKKIITIMCVISTLFLASALFAAKKADRKNTVNRDVSFSGDEIGLSFGLRGVELLAAEGNPLESMEVWVGMHIYVMPELFIAPELMGMYTDRKYDDNGVESNREVWKTGAGLGAYYQFSTGGNVFLYAGPKFEFKYKSYKNEEDSGSEVIKKTIDATVLAVIGGRYMVSESFGIFADFGLGFNFRNYEYQDRDSFHVLTEDYTDHYYSFYSYKGQVGVAFYF
ncbi:MAG: hypothetical protein CVV44_10720 [Spirochaetae bacterium HGW-Spirochaetae-1]|nr:MAG: hypothetical protein CVV44_10720 [Spirochaetae bacterium HGW-Spirochaetae-1]